MNEFFSSKGQCKLFQSILLTTIMILTGCSSNHKTDKSFEPSSTSKSTSHLIEFRCLDAKTYASQVVGTGHCVSLIRNCSGAPHTNRWKPGPYVLSQPANSVESGTIIATFLNGHYPNKTGWHAAIYISHNENGIWVWDQWLGQPVHRRFIRHRVDKATAANKAQDYRIVLF